MHTHPPTPRGGVNSHGTMAASGWESGETAANDGPTATASATSVAVAAGRSIYERALHGCFFNSEAHASALVAPAYFTFQYAGRWDGFLCLHNPENAITRAYLDAESTYAAAVWRQLAPSIRTIGTDLRRVAPASTQATSVPQLVCCATALSKRSPTNITLIWGPNSLA